MAQAVARSHSLYSPSSSSMWMGCFGSLNRIKKLVKNGYRDERNSIFAAEGTVAHAIREEVLIYGFDVYDFVGQTHSADGFTFEITEEFVEYLIPGLDRINEFPGDLLVEIRVDTTPWVGLDDDGNPQGGTLDAIRIDWANKHMMISDLKFGMGVPVQAVGNKQLRIYLLGLTEWIRVNYPDVDLSDWTFTIIIDQPRHSEGGGEWTIDYDDLMDFAEEVIEAARETRKPNAKCTPGVEICRWCPCANIDNACPEHEEWKLDFLGLEFEDLDETDPLELPDIEGITKKRRSYIVQNQSVIISWLKRLHADALTDALNGDPCPGLKAVEGRRAGIRKHKDEAKSLAFMKKRLEELRESPKFKLSAEEALYKKVLRSPADAEKVLKLGTKKFPSTLIEQSDPKPVLVPVDDDRPAIFTETEFDNYDDEFVAATHDLMKTVLVNDFDDI